MSSTSVIMVSFRTGPVLLLALDAALSDPFVSELILVDNGNSNKARQTFPRHPKLQILQGHGNIGFAQACNYGAALSSGEVLVFLNPDAIVHDGAIEKLRNVALMSAKPVIAGGLLLNEDGTVQRGSRRGPLRLRAILRGINRTHRVWLDYGQPYPVPTISGAFFAMSRESFDAIGGFDGGYFLHVEDVDICQRHRDAGGDVLCVPEARTRHLGATSDVSVAQVEWWKYKSFMRFFYQNQGVFKAVLVAAPLAIALVIRFVSRRKRRAAQRVTAADHPSNN